MSGAGYLVALNADAGSAKGQKMLDAIEILASDGPTEVRWASDLDDLSAAIVDASDRTLVGIGGDGTVHQLLAAVARSERPDRPVGLLPAGTGNDFARNVGLPLDPSDAAKVIVDGRPQWLPTIEGPAGPIANNVHFGLGQAAARRASALKAPLGRLAYPVATALTGLGYQGHRLDIEVDGRKVFDRDALACLVLLGPSVGGGVELTETEFSIPQLRVIVVTAGPAKDRLKAAWAASRGSLDSVDGVEAFSGAHVEISSRDGELPVDVDGELTSWPTPIRLDVTANGWRVLLPAT